MTRMTTIRTCADDLPMLLHEKGETIPLVQGTLQPTHPRTKRRQKREMDKIIFLEDHLVSNPEGENKDDAKDAVQIYVDFVSKHSE